ncbi:P-loop containing nucleoside triphosphate hydrolase protein [Lineolata rhizophorae]|uniref:RNA helicase n=1 Tax=Lineolata rhizophorae TaxID=578093 RepID=A0A6A6NND0_9PEZI|nr:P-loop containing nucleoside triphosphate hydrolase protein [Lineolata rhizophorae]
MPRNPHPPRNAGGTKKTPAADEPKDSSKKAGGSSKAGAAGAQSQGQGKDAKGKGKGKEQQQQQQQQQQQEEEKPKKPDAKTIIGGASWTGKLPVNMLSEHCQRMKWDKPEYVQKRPSPGQRGHCFAVVLRATNPKTHEKTTLAPIFPPPSHAHLAVHPTALEARHFAAAFALHRISSMKNVHMALPPTYRDLWRGAFAEVKTQVTRDGAEWLYAADPFAALREREEERAKAEKRRAELARAREKERSRAESMPGGGLGAALGREHEGGAGAGNRMKGWTQAPKVEMGRRTRAAVERLVRRDSVWNPHGRHIPPAQLPGLVDAISGLGFRRAHVEEAAAICRDREEVLEWLLIHVPEDDLPRWSLPEKYVAGVSMASGDLKREAKVKELAAGGYATELCEETLDGTKGDEAKAQAMLQARLLEGTEEMGQDLAEDLQGTGLEESDWAEETAWEEEQEILKSIYDTRYEEPSPTVSQITLDVVLPADSKNIKSGTSPIILKARKPPPSSTGITYPSTLPLIAIHASSLPAYIRLSITKRALLHVRSDLLGTPMLFALTDWLESNIPSLVDSPDPLSAVAAATGSRPPTLTHQPGHRQHLVQQTRSAPKNNRGLPPRQNSPTSLALQRAFAAKQANPRYKSMQAQRQSLPAWAQRDAVVDAVARNAVTIVAGATGSGKSTQCVQFVLDALVDAGAGERASIVCTQPRRISALGLAERVAEERAEPRVGAEVGYAIRGESRTTRGNGEGSTKILFCTTGVLLRRLQTAGAGTGPQAEAQAEKRAPEDVAADALADVSHVFVDEVHERSLDTDFLLVLLREVLRAQRKRRQVGEQELKVVLMSATMDAEAFEEYFSEVGSVGMIEIEGRTFPVDDFYLEDVVRMTGFRGSAGLLSMGEETEYAGEDGDELQAKATGAMVRSLGPGINYELICETVRGIHEELGSKDGAILVFLPGTMEIERTVQILRSIPKIHALPLHASLLPLEQRRVFPPAPPGRRKVVVATNVAETSITIPDIVAVIDTGRVKETSFDPVSRTVRLAETWASRAACNQRRGRAGRVTKGNCYRLFTHAIWNRQMPERPEPEIRRVPLEMLCLAVKAMGVSDVARFLAGAPTPPDSSAVGSALSLLVRMGALDGSADDPGDLTALGRHLAMIPADLRVGKLLVLAATLGALEAGLTIAATLSVRFPFVVPRDKRDASRAARAAFAPRGQGDVLADLRAFEAWDSLRSERQKGAPGGGAEVAAFCERNFLSQHALREIASNRAQYLATLKETGWVPLAYGTGAFAAAAEQQKQFSALNRHTGNDAVLRALVAASFNPQIARVQPPEKKFAASAAGAVQLDPEARAIKYFDRTDGRVFVHPGSTLFDLGGLGGGDRNRFVAFYGKWATSKVFLRELTPFNSYTLLLFAGPIALDTLGRGLVVDDWLRLRGWARIGVLVSRLRAMLDDLLAQKIVDPALDLAGSDVVEVVRRLVELDGMDN